MKINVNITCSLVLLVFVGCTSLNPKYSEKSTADYNQRVEIKKPHYKANLNAAGIGVTVGMAGAGAYLGYEADLIAANNAEHNVEYNKYAGAVCGALVGYGIASLVNYLIWDQGQKKIINQRNGGDLKWIKRYDRDYKLYSRNYSDLTIIKKDIEKKYTVKTYNDFIHFAKVFPNSNYYNRIVKQFIPIANRKELVEVLGTYPNTEHSETIKLKYINKSSSLESYVAALSKYPNVKTQPQVFGMELINSISDVKLYLLEFDDFNKNELIEIANEYADDYMSVVYFNETFPNNRYKDESLIRIKDNCSTTELKKLITQFSESKSTEELKVEYIQRSSNIAEFLEYNEDVSLLDINGSLESYSETHMLINSIENAEPKLGKAFSQQMIESAKENILTKNYGKASKSDTGQKKFIREVKSRNWLASQSDTFIEKAEHQIYLNNKEEIDKKNEVDDINKYVRVENGRIQTVEGDELSLLNSIWSAVTDMGNMNAFITGELVNNGRLPKKVKLTAKLNMFEKSENPIYGDSHETLQKEGYFYTKIPPGGTSEFVILIPYKWKYKDERSIWGRNYFEVGVDRSDPVTTELEYYKGNISQSVITEQNKLRIAYNREGNVATEEGYESSYQVTSRSHNVLRKSEEADVEVTKLTNNSTQNGCLNIYSENDDDSGYKSVIKDRTNYVLDSYTDSMEDNTTWCYDTDDFPITVTVSYYSDDGNFISATVELLEYNDYTIRVTDGW